MVLGPSASVLHLVTALDSHQQPPALCKLDQKVTLQLSGSEQFLYHYALHLRQGLFRTN